MSRLITVVGARPQFIKASVVSKGLKDSKGLDEIIIHTGQHFDENMSDIFFNQLEIPKPHYQLDINSGSHGAMTGRMLEEIEKVCLKEKPDRVLVYGDTNSTLAGALAAAKLHIPVAHIEAGLRSFNMNMPEEVNRILTDQLSDILFCPTLSAKNNLFNEGFESKPVQVLSVGDVMQDAAIFFANKYSESKIQSIITNDSFILATLHRAENTDDFKRLTSIIKALNYIHENIISIILPIHPRTRKVIENSGLELKIKVINPVGYLEMIGLLKQCEAVVTDSGGLQKEAFFFQKPCVTMREETEWVELIEHKVNILAGADTQKIINSTKLMLDKRGLITDPMRIYGGGEAVGKIVKVLEENI